MKAPGRMTFGELEQEYEKDYKSKHVSETGQEIYEFNIKIQKINIPEIVREALSEEEINGGYEVAAQQALRDLIAELTYQFNWIEGWYQEGRSGGWLILWTYDMVFIDGINLSAPRKRIRDLRKIDGMVRVAKYDFKRLMEDKDSWGIGPRDWSPRTRK